MKPTVLIAIPPALGIVASIWPMERMFLALICVVLLFISMSAMFAIRSIRNLLLNTGAIAVLLSTIVFDMPLKMVFHSCRSEFDRIADAIEAGAIVETPLWIGPIRICKVERNRNQVVCLWTDDNPGGKGGFVRHGPSDLPFNLWSHVAMDDCWQFIHED